MTDLSAANRQSHEARPRSPKQPIRTSVAAFLTVLIGGFGLTACGFGDSGTLIGTTNFTESRILGQIYAVALEDAGIPTTVKELTTSEIVIPALEKNQLQVMPNYLATFTEYLNLDINGPQAPALAGSSVAKTFAAGQPLATEKGLTILNPAAAQDQNAFAVTPEFAKKNNVSNLSELGVWSQSNPVNLGAGPDCPTRPFCQPGLESIYNIKFNSFTALDTGGPLTVQALLQGKINLGLVFSSSGFISAYDLVVLDDDKNLQAADNVIPVINSEASTPAMIDALNGVSSKLTTQDLQALNAKVDIERQDPLDVARGWLQASGLVPAGG
ncbi:MAG: osmoprotectant transport system substrate-binding protein [Actinomycetes bacterium]|jgi:osmoprotectant transport system substrate-binding protein